MQRYKDYAPTGFDSKGLSADEYDIGDFGVLLGRNRDSGILDESNWNAALRALGGESEDVQVYRFGHWACGWIEILLIRPDTAAWDIATEIESAISAYPVLDEEDLSRREVEVAEDLGYTMTDSGEWIDKDGETHEIDYLTHYVCHAPRPWRTDRE